MINWTWGVGGTFTSMAALRTGLMNAVLSDDVTITMISDVTALFSETQYVSNINLNGKTLRFTSAIPHLGDPTLGYKLILPDTPFFTLSFTWTCTGTLIIDDIYAHKNTASTTRELWLIEPSQTMNTRLINCIFTSNGPTGAGFKRNQNPGGSTDSGLFEAYNNKFLNTQFQWSRPGAKIENMTIAGGGSITASGLTVAAGGVIRNCYANGFSGTIEAAAVDHNASPAATIIGSSGIVSLSNAAAFLSVDRTSPNFLKVKSPLLVGTGAAPSIAGNTVDMTGAARPGVDGVYCIGAEERDVRPSTFGILSESTGMVSHTRVLANHTTENQAAVFHNAIKAMADA